MSKLHPNASALATEQLQRSERASSENPNNTVHTQHRRHNSLSGRACTKSLAKSSSITDIPKNVENLQYKPITLPERITDAATNVLSCNSRNLHIRNNDEVDSDETRRRRLPAKSGRNELQNATKDGFLQSTTILNTNTLAMLSYDEPDHLQQRFARTPHSTAFSTRHASHNNSTTKSVMDNSLNDTSLISGISSTESSACPSTVSSPLSTPTRLSPQHHLYQHRTNNLQIHQQQQQSSTCCQKSNAPVKNSCSSATSSLNNYHHNHHLPEHNNQQPNKSSSFDSVIVSGSKNLKKFDPRLGPSPYRQLLPIALCILSFATVFSILIVYMDTTEIRHQQFRLNMSRDYDLFGVAQDDPQLIAFLREIHMRKYPNHFFKTSPSTEDNALPGAGVVSGGGGNPGNTFNGLTASHLNLSAYPNELTPKMAYYVANTMQGKTNGAVIQSLTGSLGHLLTAPWFTETLNWAGFIVEPEPRRYFTLRKQNALRPRLQIVHACVSPNPYPKEVTIHNEESEVRINSLLDEETSWFNSRVKCFPLYTIMLASNRVEYDLLSLGVHGHELEILQTLPFDKIKIEVISIHLLENQEDVSNYVQTITKFLLGKSYKIQKKFGRNYFYQRFTSTTSNVTPTRTRKKDILLLKTP